MCEITIYDHHLNFIDDLIKAVELKLLQEQSTQQIIDNGGNTIQLTTSVLPQPLIGTLIADSSGGIEPIKRTIAQTSTIISQNPFSNTVTVLPEGYVPSTTTWQDLDNQIFEIDLGQVNVQSIYEGDIVLVNINVSTLDSTGEVAIYSLIVEGVSHQDGKGI